METKEQKMFTIDELFIRWKGKVSKQKMQSWRSSGEGGPFFVKINGIKYPEDRLIEWELANGFRVEK